MSVEIMPRADAEWHLLLENQKAESNTLREQVATLTAERDEAREELGSVLSDWNALVKASGSLTHGSAVGVVARLRADVERLTKELGDATKMLDIRTRTVATMIDAETRHLAAIETLRICLDKSDDIIRDHLPGYTVQLSINAEQLAKTADYAKKADEVSNG